MHCRRRVAAGIPFRSLRSHASPCTRLFLPRHLFPTLIPHASPIAGLGGWSGSPNYAVCCNGNTEGRSSQGDTAALGSTFQNARGMVVGNAQFYWIAAAQARAALNLPPPLPAPSALPKFGSGDSQFGCSIPRRTSVRNSWVILTRAGRHLQYCPVYSELRPPEVQREH